MLKSNHLFFKENSKSLKIYLKNYILYYYQYLLNVNKGFVILNFIIQRQKEDTWVLKVGMTGLVFFAFPFLEINFLNAIYIKNTLPLTHPPTPKKSSKISQGYAPFWSHATWESFSSSKVETGKENIYYPSKSNQFWGVVFI